MKNFITGCVIGLMVGLAVSFIVNKLNLFYPGKFLNKPIIVDKGGELIDAESAYKFTRNHRNREIIGEGRKKNGRSHYFTRSFLNDTMFFSKKVVGLNFYPGLKTTGENEAFLLVVGVDKEGHDILPPKVFNGNKIEYPIGISLMKCPDNCDDSSLMYTGK